VPLGLACRKLLFIVLLFNFFLPKYVVTFSNNNDVTTGDLCMSPLGNNNLLEAKQNIMVPCIRGKHNTKRCELCVICWSV
jgi:hypothetical protein